MVEDRDLICYELLMKVFRDKAYASIELNAALGCCSPQAAPYITKLFYGVLEKSVYYDYVISRYAAAKPKKPIAVIIKMGLYMLHYLSIPQYAAVNNAVNLCKRVGKGGAAGFVNSFLRNCKPVELPREGSLQYLSVKYSRPEWLCRALVEDYGYDFARKMLAYESDGKTHIRVNYAHISQAEFDKKYSADSNAQITRTPVGYYISGKELKKFDGCDYVVQSAASAAAAYSYVYGLNEVRNVLDLCAAPGGKAVMVKTLTNAKVTACDIHPHRVELIRKYALNCGADINAVVNDATVFRPEWANKFDLVICDVPCSGLGVISSKPDILFNREPADIDALVKLQSEILNTAAEYVKEGGRLCYSTCTVLRKENGGVTDSFIKSHALYARENIKSPYSEAENSQITLFPHVHATDGFYVAAFKKIKDGE